MKLTLTQKREIVSRFLDDPGVEACALLVWNWYAAKITSLELWFCKRRVEETLRSYLRGDFQLAKRRGKS